MSDLRPDRVRITGPRTGRPRHTTIAAEIDRQSVVGEIYLRTLIRAQLRLALGVIAILAATLGLLPVLFHEIPALRSFTLWGVPLPWLLLGAGGYPFLILLGRFYIRRAEQNEVDFNELLVDPSADDDLAP